MTEGTDRLDSWKQIAAYLDKSERTVRRWHETEGMPVHKHQHQQRGPVWAYEHEIKEWLEQRRVSPTPAIPEEPETAPLVEPLPKVAPETPNRRWALVGVVSVVLTVIGGAAWVRRDNPHGPGLAIEEPVAVTALPGREFGPAFSPDGKQIAFFWTGPGTNQAGIYLKTIGTESVTPLVVGPGFLYSPAWSPDGRTIAYLRRTENRVTWLCLTASSGGPEKRLIRLHEKEVLSGDNRHLSWSRDGRRILAPLEVEGGQWAIHWISVGDAATQRVTEPAAKIHGPVLSPSGRSFVFLRSYETSRGGDQEIVRQELESDGSAAGAPQQLSRGPGFISGLVWTPDGKNLILCKAKSGYEGNRLYRMSALPGAPMTPISGAQECSSLAISAADEKGGARLAYGLVRELNVQLWKAELKDLEHGSPFAASSRSDSQPAFSPNGQLVAFRSTRSGGPAVWMANQDGTHPRRVSDLPVLDWSIAWSPDGTKLLFGSARVGLAMVPVTGGETSILVGGADSPGGGLPVSPYWPHGGGVVYYASAYRLYQIRPDGSGRSLVNDREAPPLTQTPVIRTSPDGETIFLTRPEGLFRRARKDGAEELIEPRLLVFSIAATKTGIYYIRREDKALYMLPFAGGAAKKLGALRPFYEGGAMFSGFTVSPDDRTIVWTVGNSQEIDLEMIADLR